MTASIPYDSCAVTELKIEAMMVFNLFKTVSALSARQNISPKGSIILILTAVFQVCLHQPL